MALAVAHTAFESYPASAAYGSIKEYWQSSGDASYQPGGLEAYPTGIWAPESLACDFLPPGVTRVLAVTERCPYNMRLRSEWVVRDFVLVKEIGTGNASTVWYAFCKKTSMPLAIKTYKKRKLSPLNRCQVAREINIHAQLDHPNVIALYAAFEDNDKVYLLQEFAEGGDLFDEMKRTMGRMPESQLVTSVLLPMMSALLAMHCQGFIHRDIKPENTLFAAGRVLKLADFGLAVNHLIERPVTRLGTLDYMAPEVLVCPDKHLPSDNKQRRELWYTPAVDAWALGVLAYELAVGRPPFGMSTRDETIRAIRASPPSFPEFMSPGLVDYISQALVKPAEQRSSLADLMQHPWILEHARRAGMDAQVLAYLQVHQAEHQVLAAAAAAVDNIGPLPQQQLHHLAPAGPESTQLLQQQQQPSSVAAAAVAAPRLLLQPGDLASGAPAAAAPTAASYMAGLASADQFGIAGSAAAAAAAAESTAAAGMNGVPPRVKKTAKRSGMPRCYSSKNIAGLSNMANLAGGQQHIANGHIHWHANGEMLALHVPGLMLDMNGSDSPRSSSPSTNSPTAAQLAAAAAAGSKGNGHGHHALQLSKHHSMQPQTLQPQGSQECVYNPAQQCFRGLAGAAGLGGLLTGLQQQQQQTGLLLPGSPTRRQLAVSRLNSGSSGSGASKQGGSSKRCTPEPDSDMAATLLALGRSNNNSSRSPSSSHGGTDGEICGTGHHLTQQLMQQYLRQQQAQLAGDTTATGGTTVQPAAAAVQHCQLHGHAAAAAFVCSPNASPRPMSRFAAAAAAAGGSSSSSSGVPCSCSGSSSMATASAAAIGSASGSSVRSSSTKYSPCSPVLKQVMTHQFESPLKRVNSQGTLTGLKHHSGSSSTAQLTHQLSLPLALPPLHQQQRQSEQQQQQVPGMMMAADVDRLQHAAAAAAAAAKSSSAYSPLPPQATAAATGLQVQLPSNIVTGTVTDSVTNEYNMSAQASPAGLHMQELADVLRSPGSVANLLNLEHVQQQQQYAVQQQQQQYAVQQQQQQQEAAQQQQQQQQEAAQQQQQQQVCSRRIDTLRKPVLRACSAPSLLHPALQLQLQQLQAQQQQQQQQQRMWGGDSQGPSTNSLSPEASLSTAAAAASAALTDIQQQQQQQQDVQLLQLQLAHQQQQQQQQALDVQMSPFATALTGNTFSSGYESSMPHTPAAAAANANLMRVLSNSAMMSEQLQQQQQLAAAVATVSSPPLYRASSPGLVMLQQQQQQQQVLQAGSSTSWDAAAAVDAPVRDAQALSAAGMSRNNSLLSADLGPLQPISESAAATYDHLPPALISSSSASWQQQQQRQAVQQAVQLQQEVVEVLIMQQQQAQQLQLQCAVGAGSNTAAAAASSDLYQLAGMACSPTGPAGIAAAAAAAADTSGQTSPLNARLVGRHPPSRLAHASSYDAAA